jgi:eukaryotic-like serine/threonine-protein kinase
MSFKNFLLSKVFIKNLGLAVSIIVGAVMVVLIWMNFYTRHGQARPVPDFFGLNMEQTAKLAKKSRLKYQIIDSVYTTLVARGCVAEQNPRPGFKVKKWRNIVLTINAFNPEKVAMPNMVGLSIRQAIALIGTSGLEMGQLKYKPDLSIDLVLEQLYKGKHVNEGDSLQKGSVVDLVLGKGLSNMQTPVPDLIGMKLEAATNRILTSSLNLGAFNYDSTVTNSDDTLNSFVFKQNPAFKEDARLKLGDVIYLWLSVDSAKLPVDSTLFIISDTIPSPEINKGPSN